MQFITFETQEAFDAWHAEINTLKGFDDGRGTVTYTHAEEGTDGVFYAAIRDKDVALLEEMTSPYVAVVDYETKEAAMPEPEDEMV